MSSGESTYARSFLKVVLISGGVSPSAKYRFYDFFSYTLTTAVIFVLFGDVVGMLNESNLHFQIVTVLHMVGFSMGLVLHWCIRLNGLTLLRFINDYFQPDYLDPRVISYTENRFSKISKVLTAVYWTFHLNFVLSTFVHAITGGIHDTKSYILPTFYKCSTQSNDTHWISSLCWNVDTSQKYFLVNSFVSVVYLTLLVPYGTTFLFFLFIVIYIDVNVEVFKERAASFSKNLSDHAKKCNKLSRQGDQVPSSADTLAQVQMRETVHYYTKLRRALADVSPLMNYLATCNLVVFSIMACSILVVILKVPSTGENILFMIEYALQVMLFFWYFALPCVGGETLRNMNTEVVNTIYDLPWYNQSVKFQKSMNMFIMLLMIRPLEVNVLLMTIQLRICMVFLQRMYSVLNLILTRI